MISVDTWFYFRSQAIQKEIDSGKADFTKIGYCSRAKELVDFSLQTQIEMFYQNQKLSDVEKNQMTDDIANEFVKVFDHYTTLNVKTVIDEVEFPLKEVFYNILFPMDNQITHVDFELLIKCLLDVNNNPYLFFVDTYSIYKIGQDINLQKKIFSAFEKKHPSNSKRKSTYRNITKIKEAILSPHSEAVNKLSLEQKIFAEYLSKLVQNDKSKLLFDSMFSSKKKSPKLLLKLIPSRIITKKEINRNDSISFRQNKAKNTILYDLLKSFYPEYHNYYSCDDYPTNYNTEYDKYVDATVKQKFY